jgi:hypothetical protein
MGIGALAQLFHIGRQRSNQQIGAVKLGEQPDDLFLRRLILAELFADACPDVVDGPPAVHHAEHEVRGRRNSVKAAGLVVLEQIPDITAKYLAVDLGMRAQPGLHSVDPVP